MSRSSVVFPVPFAPTSAVFAPSPTRKLTSSNSTRPSGSTCVSETTSTYPMTSVWWLDRGGSTGLGGNGPPGCAPGG